MCFEALGDPVSDSGGLHYKPFDDLYGKATSEEHRPSLQSSAQERNSHGIPFSPSAQTARTVGQTVTCVECSRPRVIYAQRKLSFQEGQRLQFWRTSTTAVVAPFRILPMELMTV